MEFYKNIGITQDIIAAKLARCIYRSYHRYELNHRHDSMAMELIKPEPNTSLYKSYPVYIYRNLMEIDRLIQQTLDLSNNQELIDLVSDMQKVHKSVARCNELLIKYYLKKGWTIRWSGSRCKTNYKHIYNLKETVGVWDSIKQH